MSFVIDSKYRQELNNAEYLKALEKWHQDMYARQQWYYTSWQAFILNQAMTYQLSASINPQQATSISTGDDSFASYQAQPQSQSQVGGIECRLPPLWKRLLAELIDFLCLFSVKLIATFILVDYLNIIEWSKYDFDTLVQKTWHLDYNAAMELTSELMIVEFAHRITVCVYETFWLHRGYHGVIGGATPGKKLMNLRVVSCERVITVRNEPNIIVLVSPGSDLGLIRASIRSFIKNFLLALFLPFTFTFLYFQYNRTGYDVLAQSIVIEDPLRYHSNR